MRAYVCLHLCDCVSKRASLTAAPPATAAGDAATGDATAPPAAGGAAAGDASAGDVVFCTCEAMTTMARDIHSAQDTPTPKGAYVFTYLCMHGCVLIPAFVLHRLLALGVRVPRVEVS